MTGSPDKAVMALIGVGLAVWVVYRIYVWLQSSPRSFLQDHIPLNEEINPHPAVSLLEDAGYEVVGGKLKIPLSFNIDGAPLYSRLFVDYIAAAEDGTQYLVVLARPRRPVEWTGSGVRDILLPYLLIYPGVGGLLYVNAPAATVNVITFGRDDGEND
ncbi:hypothetical protein SAMN04487895_10674 [Paenibacillus sophorae]|uniref:Uncharacterized protein n=1 Tax=Paenibacillus sophorae TaxID=1333845 RepID=A0A1H8N645_9BACL|nr:hypothetical protein [Paenibacillus sophorae]QWU14763.1 hypothetical protein KP014_23000 [Paenibacillus sophorae]SEO25016.1 hypothetical protein SAMN04487895_10674 [Paenibacillus sophorae]